MNVFYAWGRRHLAAIEDGLSVRLQFGLAAAALCLTLVAVICTGVAFVSRQQTTELISGHMAQLARSMAEQLDTGMFEHYREIQQLASMEPIASVWTGAPEDMRVVLRQMARSHPEYTWIGLASQDGTVRAATRGLLEGASVSERPWFRNGLKQPTVEDVHEAKLLASLLAADPTGEPFRFVDVAFPIRTKDGEVAGVLGAHLSWRWASELCRRVLQGSVGEDATDIWILSRDGTVLLGDETGDKPFDAARVAAMATSKSGAFVDGSDASAMLTGYAQTAGYRDYPGLGWTVIARQPAEIAFASARDLAWLIAAWGGAIALIAVGLAMIIAQRVARPIRALTDEADRIGRDSDAAQLPWQSGSAEVIRLSMALRSLLRRAGFAEMQTQRAETRAAENAAQFAHDLDALRRLADTDPLTNLMNRRGFLVSGKDALDYFRRYQRSVAILVIDIDHFKAVNDSHGHAAGDMVIRRVGEVIETMVRSTDRVARFGGEEFVVLLREVDAVTVRTSSDRIRTAIEAAEVGYHAATIHVTVSVGAALAETSDRDIEDTIERADKGLYIAKSTGRNRTVVVTPDRPEERRAA